MRALGSKSSAVLFCSFLLANLTFAQSPNEQKIIASANSASSGAASSLPVNVRLQSGELSIQVENATLKEVLDAVKVNTGATIDAPTLDGTTRVAAAKFGPGDPKQVLTSLLYGTKYNFYVLTSLDSPDKIDRLILKERVGGIDEAFSVHNAAAAAVEKEAHESRVLASLNAAHGSSAIDADGKKTPQQMQRAATLPNEINPAIWNLYPQLAQGGGAAGADSSTSTGLIGNKQPEQSRNSPYMSGSSKPQVDSNGQVTLPPGVSPEIFKLYPPNLMDLIKSSGSSGSASVSNPAAAPAPGRLWDQTLHP